MNQHAMRKHVLPRRILVAILSLTLVITMMPALAGQAYADITDDMYNTINTIATYNDGGSGPGGSGTEEGTLYSYLYGNTITVTGSLTGATETLDLEIPSGVKVIWQAELSGDVGADPDVSLVNISGGGIFEMAGGELTNSKDTDGDSSYYTIHVSAYSTVNITSGTVSATGEESVAIRATDNSTVNIAGGAVSNTGGFGIALAASKNTKVNITGGQVSTTGIGSYAIFTNVSSTEIVGEVNIEGGAVSASGEGSYAIYHHPQENDVEYNFTITIFANAIIIGKTIDNLTYDKTIKVSTPTATPYSATFTTERTVTLSATTPGAKIYYTTDGTVPTTGSTLYSGPFKLTSTATVKAIAVKANFVNSEVLSATFTKAPAEKVAKPVATPNGGTFATEQTVTLSSDTLGASIYYTTDGTEPTTGSTLYSAPFKLTATTMVKAIAVKENFVNSEILSVTFTKASADTTAISGVTVKAIPDKAYTGKQIKPIPTLKINGVTLKNGTDFILGYAGHTKIGEATITITGQGKYAGTKTVSFKIVPKKTSVSKVTVGKNQLKVTWKKVSAAQKITKYEVRYKIKGAKKWQTKTASAKSANLTIKKLQKGKTYQIQIRSYKTVSKVKYYSAWSAVKTSAKVK
jgi:hypothetical protein